MTQYTGNAAADFMLGFPVQFRQASGDPNLDGSSWVYGGYGQDEFRVSRVTLSYGVRYELNQPFAERQDHLNAFHPGQQSQIFPTAPTGLVYPGDPGVPRGTYPTDKNKHRAASRRRVGSVRRWTDERPRCVGPLLRHAARAGRFLSERYARASVSAVDRSEFPAADDRVTVGESAPGRIVRMKAVPA